MVTAEVERPPLAGRLIGATSVATLGALAATAAGPSYQRGAKPLQPCLGERLASLDFACGRQADWIEAARP